MQAAPKVFQNFIEADCALPGKHYEAQLPATAVTTAELPSSLLPSASSQATLPAKHSGAAFERVVALHVTHIHENDACFLARSTAVTLTVATTMRAAMVRATARTRQGAVKQGAPPHLGKFSSLS